MYEYYHMYHMQKNARGDYLIKGIVHEIEGRLVQRHKCNRAKSRIGDINRELE